MVCGLYGIVRRCGAIEPLGRRGQPDANIVDFCEIEEKVRIYRLLSSIASLIKNQVSQYDELKSMKDKCNFWGKWFSHGQLRNDAGFRSAHSATVFPSNIFLIIKLIRLE